MLATRRRVAGAIWILAARLAWMPTASFVGLSILLLSGVLTQEALKRKGAGIR